MFSFNSDINFLSTGGQLDISTGGQLDIVVVILFNEDYDVIFHGKRNQQNSTD